jgi:hypothetical protein
VRGPAGAIVALALISAPTAAQKPKLAVLLPEPALLAVEGPMIVSSAMVSDGAMRDLLNNGFPARLHYRIERWGTGGWFDDIKATAEWDVLVKYDALNRRYDVYRAVRGRATSLGSFDLVTDADAAIGAAVRAPGTPPRSGRRSSYNVVLEIETLSLTELDEVERWLRGELKPAVRGEKNPGTAVSRGVRTLVVRLLGGEKRRYEARSGTFRP